MAMTVYNYPPSVFCSLRIRLKKKKLFTIRQCHLPGQVS